MGKDKTYKHEKSLRVKDWVLEQNMQHSRMSSQSDVQPMQNNHTEDMQNNRISYAENYAMTLKVRDFASERHFSLDQSQSSVGYNPPMRGQYEDRSQTSPQPNNECQSQFNTPLNHSIRALEEIYLPNRRRNDARFSPEPPSIEEIVLSSEHSSVPPLSPKSIKYEVQSNEDEEEKQTTGTMPSNQMPHYDFEEERREPFSTDILQKQNPMQQDYNRWFTAGTEPSNGNKEDRLGSMGLPTYLPVGNMPSNHEQNNNEEGEIFSCQICNFEVNSYESLQTHLQGVKEII